MAELIRIFVYIISDFKLFGFDNSRRFREQIVGNSVILAEVDPRLDVPETTIESFISKKKEGLGIGLAVSA